MLDPDNPAEPRLASTLCLPRGDLWVFGYGSLMWNPGFPHCEVHVARLHGHHRALCVRSKVHRGTPARPGLVVGLDHGGSCVGRAYRVREGHEHEAVDYLQEREMVTRIYIPKFKPVRLPDGRRERALTFIVDRAHSQYVSQLSADEAVKMIRDAAGRSGQNRDYVANTVAHLDELGIADTLLHRVNQMLGEAG